MKHDAADVLVIGSGIAGLTFALRAAEHGSVCVVTKKERAASSTNYAQGGIAAVMSPDDSQQLHVRDTLVAGAGLCHLRAVEALVREGPARVQDLMDWGVRFTRAREQLSLGREGGHSRRRILHAGDLTGREIERALLQAVAEHERIRLVEDLQAVDISTSIDGDGTARCTGALLLEHRTDALVQFDAALVLLATGGLGNAYRHTTNPDIATGDGVAMAYRAGVPVANLEFVQFHPTALYPADEHAFLISEAVRGEGAVLRRQDGSDLMAAEHPLGSLAPRDVVARAIDMHLKESGTEFVWLDLSAIGAAKVRSRFPGILAECRERGIDILREPIPVVPAAHYSCGGVQTDDSGRTGLPGLYAAGEVACTGVHGANRLASNSLLEAVVYSHRAALRVHAEMTAAAAFRGSARASAEPGGNLGAVRGNDDAPGNGSATGDDTAGRSGAAAGGDAMAPRPGAATVRVRLRDLMWEKAGIARSTAPLQEAAAELAALRGPATALFDACVQTDTVELRNLLEAAALIVACAAERRESRGLQYNVDYPYRDNERYLRDTVMTRGQH
jgi:L-aspartate oxidase